MNSRGKAEFWRLYHALPPSGKEAARQAYRRCRENPAQPGLHLERLAFDPRAWSIRVTRNIRAVALRTGDDGVWFWIGTHQEFDRAFPR